jgi:hypothetical protein
MVADISGRNSANDVMMGCGVETAHPTKNNKASHRNPEAGLLVRMLKGTGASVWRACARIIGVAVLSMYLVRVYGRVIRNLN